MATRRRVTTKPDENCYINFSVIEWLTDPALARCGGLAKGVWIQMIARMALEPVRGVLEGDSRELARVLGMTVEEFEAGTVELERHGVFRRGSDVHPELSPDAIVCGWMYRTGELSETRAAAGRKGASVQSVDASGSNVPKG